MLCLTLLLGVGTAADRLPAPSVQATFFWGDIDGDQLDDAFVLVPDGSAKLLRNLGDGTFQDVTPEVGLDGLDHTTVASFADVDQDGRLDLFVGCCEGGRLFRNLGQAFEDVTTRTALALEGEVLSAGWHDFDQDGLADLHVRTDRGDRLFRNLAGLAFEPVDLHLPADAGSAPGAAWREMVATGEPTAVRPTDGEEPSPADQAPAGSVAPRGAAGPLGRTGLFAGSGATTSGVHTSMAPPPACVDTVRDSYTSSCVAVSSSPRLGTLYPLGREFNIQSRGQVGIGTLATSLYHVYVTGGGLESAAVYASHSSTTGSTHGVWGTTVSPSGIGVRGQSTATNGTPTGVYGHVVAGTGVHGVATASQGQTIGVRGSASSPSGYAGFFEGRGHFTGNVGIGINAGAGSTAKLDVAGDIRATTLLPGRRAVDATNTGPLGVAVQAENTNQFGYAVLAVSNSDFPAAAFTQNGAGSVLKGSNSNGVVFEVKNNGRCWVRVLEIQGGSDLVEGFEAPEGSEPGVVLVIDPMNPGRLVPSSEPYDPKVAGVVSGAGGVEHGIRLGQDNVLDGDTLVAMVGRVYVRCSAENGPIRPGDRLTTASTPGCAMKATDAARCDGAVLGKAMSSLDEGTGLVLVLVNLQ